MNGLPTEPLTAKRENELAKMKTEDTFSELALHAMHEAIPYARKVCRGALPDDELFSLCWTALLKAAKQFRPNHARFFAYAKVSVRRGICDEWRSKDVVKNSSIHEDSNILTDSRAKHDGVDDGTFRADGDYAENLVGYCPDGGLTGCLGTITAVLPETDKICITELWSIVEPIMRARLSKTEFMTLDLHYRGEMNFQEIADILGVVREATRLAHIRALKKIRSELTRRKALL